MPSHRDRAWLFALPLVLVVAAANGHQGETHDAGIQVPAQQAATSNSTLPVNVGGDFTLVNHFGELVSRETYADKYSLVFFGYTHCKNMCSLTLTRIGRAMELLGSDVDKVYPLVITVDPERDTPASLKEELPQYHPSLIGHTGGPGQLKQMYDNYNQNPTANGVDWDDDPIIFHQSYIFLMDPEGKLATFFPPILNPESMADIISKYINSTG